MGEWVRFGIDGFYTDTGHSIHRVAPGWLEEIQRRIQMRHPGIIFGAEAHWMEAGGFIRRGASFAQGYSLYHDWLREVAYRRKSARDLMEHLRATPLEILERMLNFLENHDEDRFAYHLELSRLSPDLQAKANRAFSALLVLGIPGIPVLNSGQEIGMRMKWQVTGNSWQRDEDIRRGADPASLAPESFDPFADQSDEAQSLREWFAQLFSIRNGNRAFWQAGGTRFLPTNNPHTFVSYRASGDKRALVIMNLDTSASSPGQTTSTVIDLSGLNLGPQEAAGLRTALARPILQAPADASLNWKTDTPPETLSFLMGSLRPFQVLVFEFESQPAPAISGPAGVTGLEESNSADSLYELTDPPAMLSWEAGGGDVSPSPKERFRRGAVKGFEAGMGLYASVNPGALIQGALKDELRELCNHLPDEGSGLRYGSIYDDSVPTWVRDRIIQILSAHAPKVRARIFLNEIATGNRHYAGADMTPINLYKDGGIRYRAEVPADSPKLEGDHYFTVEVRREIKWESWDEQRGEPPAGEEWFRLSEAGWIRVDPKNPAKDATPDPLQSGAIARFKQGVLPGGRLLIAQPTGASKPSKAVSTPHSPSKTITVDRMDRSQVVSGLVNQMFDMEIKGNLWTVGANVGSWAGSSLTPAQAECRVERWWMPMDELDDQEPELLCVKNKVRIGMLPDWWTSVFVLEAQEKDQAGLIEEGQRMVALLEKQGVVDYNAWGVVGRDGVGRLFIAPRRLTQLQAPPDQQGAWKPEMDEGKPLAHDNLWLVWMGESQYRLVSWGELEVYGYKLRGPRCRFQRAVPGG